jgi:ribonuclease BN (tRNA processing enzyme)
MQLLFLGTGAADWGIKSEKDILEDERRFSAMLIDNQILVDVAPQSFDYAKRLGIDLSLITDVLLSHTHSDHYSKEALLQFGKASINKINVWCHSGAVERLGLSDGERKNFIIHPLKRQEVVEISGYKVTTLAANHIVEHSEETPLHYVIADKEKTLFYGCDGGWFTAETWEYMRNLVFDAMILDATVGEKDGDFRLGTHNSIPMLRLIVAALKENKMIKEKAVLLANHLARTLHCGREETKELFKQIGMKVAHDGLPVEI